MIDLSLIKKYDVAGPRYTSYPTALQFRELTPDEYRASVAASDANAPLSVYCHLPFCATLCYYCACSKVLTRDRSKCTHYLSYLHREIEMQAPLFGDREVTQLHWGGGTPTFLDDDEVRALMAHLAANFRFAPEREREFSIEIDPRTVDAGRIRTFRDVGFNRLSFGIQDFDAGVQAAVNRRQSYEDTRDVMRAAREAGFGSISVDLIYGLPLQSVSSFDETLEKVIDLSPDRISIYNYAHLPDRFPSQKRINVIDLPSADQKLEILKLCIDKLTERGYCHIGMDHFAKPTDELAIAQREGTLQRNFQGYSTRAECDMVGLGVTSIGRIGNGYAQNAKTIEAYVAALDAGDLAIRRGVETDDDDALRYAVIMSLICHYALDFGEVEHQFGINFRDYFARELAMLAGFEADELLTLDARGIYVTDAGRYLIRNICMVFDRYLAKPQAEPRYSKVI